MKHRNMLMMLLIAVFSFLSISKANPKISGRELTCPKECSKSTPVVVEKKVVEADVSDNPAMIRLFLMEI